jgi:hypothetical protein
VLPLRHTSADIGGAVGAESGAADTSGFQQSAEMPVIGVSAACCIHEVCSCNTMIQCSFHQVAGCRGARLIAAVGTVRVVVVHPGAVDLLPAATETAAAAVTAALADGAVIAAACEIGAAAAEAVLLAVRYAAAAPATR